VPSDSKIKRDQRPTKVQGNTVVDALIHFSHTTPLQRIVPISQNTTCLFGWEAHCCVFVWNHGMQKLLTPITKPYTSYSGSTISVDQKNHTGLLLQNYQCVNLYIRLN